ncbi:Techylectin-5A, partial [Araneus ventricosus]
STPIVLDENLRDCSGVLASGRNKSGVYTIWPKEHSTTGKPLKIYCDMETDGGGWTVIQRRGEFPVQQDFYKNWESYKNGFGNITQEFWLGNENIRVLCEKGCKIRFDMRAENGERGFAIYQNFYLSSSYAIRINDYSGDVGDAMRYQNNYAFSTKDKGNTEKAQRLKGGWWYEDSTVFCHLNGVYEPGTNDAQTVNWYPWREHENLASVEIKVRPK